MSLYQAQFSDIYGAVAKKARMDTTDSAQLAQIKAWINQAYVRVCVETECLQEADTMTLTANTASYTLPSAVVRIKQMVVKQPNQSAYNTPLTLVPLHSILAWRQSNAGQAATNSTAYYYAVSGLNDLELYPTPASADTLLMYYVYQPQQLVNDTDLPVIPEPYASKLLEYGALLEAADYLKDVIASYTYPQSFTDWMYRFRQHLRRLEGGQTKQFPKASTLLRPPSDPSVDLRYA